MTLEVWAAQCKESEELSSRVWEYLEAMSTRKRVAEVMGCDPHAETLFAFGAMALTQMALDGIESARGMFRAAGHVPVDGRCPSGKDCSAGCPFFSGKLHPIFHMDAVAEARERAVNNRMFMPGSGVAEA
jgi:hypothetical protein